jgi:hypothetical protein
MAAAAAVELRIFHFLGRVDQEDEIDVYYNPRQATPLWPATVRSFWNSSSVEKQVVRRTDKTMRSSISMYYGHAKGAAIRGAIICYAECPP